MKWLVMGDVHLDSKAPSFRRTDNYEQACFDKLGQISRLVSYHDCEYIVCTGDWFHRKNPSQIPHRLVRRVITWLQDLNRCNIKVLTVVGNHDVPYGDANPGTFGKTAFGVLTTCPNLIVLDNYSPYYYRSLDGKVTIGFTGANYQQPRLFAGTPKEDIRQYSSDITDVFNVHVVHGNTLPKAPVWEPYTLWADAARYSTARVLHCGHIHDDLGTQWLRNKLGENCLVTNIGSLTRGSLTEENRTRIPGVLIMEYDGLVLNCRRADLMVKKAEEIYALKQSDTEKEELVQINEWVTNLRSQLAEQKEEEEDLQQTVIKSQLDVRSRELALNILNECGE